MNKIYINSETAAVTTEKFSIPREQLPVTICASGLIAGEEVVVQFTPDDGTTWTNLYLAGQKVTLVYDSNVAGIYSPLIIRMVKGITANPVIASALIKELY